EPKAMVSVDSMLNWNEHEAENKIEDGEQVYSLVARFKSDFADHAGNAAGSVSDAAAEFSMMGISPKDKIEKKEWEVKLVESLARFDKWKESSKNLAKLINSFMSTRTKLGLGFKECIRSDEVKLVESLARFDKWKESSKNLAKLINSFMSTRTKLGLGFKECIRSDEVFNLSTPNVFDLEPENKEVKSLYERFVKAGEMHEVPPSITGTFMPTSYKSDLEETLETFGSKSNTSSINTSESNDFVSCDNSDKSSESETYDFASCVSSPTTNNSFSTVDVKILPKPFFRPTNLYFDHVSWPEIYDHMSMNEGRWGSAVKSLADYDVTSSLRRGALHFARECNVKKVDEKAWYSTFKISEVKTEEPKAMVSVDSMLNWNEHEAKHKPEEGEQVYGLMAGFKSDFTDPTVNAAVSVYDAAAEFAMMGISLKYHKTQLALEEKVRILSANLENTTNTLKYFETLYDQAKIEKKEWEVKLVESLASIFDPEPITREVKSLYERLVKAGNMHEVSPSITGTFILTSSNSVLEETQVTFGLKSPTSINTSESNEFVFCDNSDKSSKSETHDFASCVSSTMLTDSFSTVDVNILPKSDVKDPSPTNGVSSYSIKENVKPPTDLCNKRRIAGRNNCNNNFVRTKTCFVYGSKYHLIKDCYVYDTVDNVPSVVLKSSSVPAGSRNSSASTSAGRSIPAASRNRSASIRAGRSISAASKNKSASIHAGRFVPAASRDRPASIHAGRHISAGRSNKPTPFLAGRTVPTGWINHAARPFFGPTNLCFDNVHPHVNKDIGIVDRGCSRSMTGNKDKLDDFVQVKGGTVTFGGGDDKITGKC
nr:ribonuclease H-like domain, reverse transcriptase, RNA-dependent DNA polymerase [Tanacetum cinerariifolium]